MHIFNTDMSEKICLFKDPEGLKTNPQWKVFFKYIIVATFVVAFIIVNKQGINIP